MKTKKSKKGKQGKREKRQKLPSMKSVLKEADAVFSRYIRERDDWTCVICGSTKRPQCGHLIRRSLLNVRFDENNCHCQCADCNYRHEWFPEHYYAWYTETFYMPVSELYALAYNEKRKRFSRAELNFIIDKYTIYHQELCKKKAKSQPALKF